MNNSLLQSHKESNQERKSGLKTELLMWLKQVGAPRSGFTCYKYPLKSCAIAVPITNKHRLQCHFAHRSQAAASQVQTWVEVRKKKIIILNVGQSVHYLNLQMKFLSALLQAVYRLNTYQMESRVWNDIRYTGSRTEDTLCFEESFIICDETFNEVMKYKVKFLLSYNPLIIVELFYRFLNLWGVCVSISSYSLRHWVLWSGHKQQQQRPSHRSVWKGAFDCQKGRALLCHFTLETRQQGVQIGSNQLHAHRWNWWESESPECAQKFGITSPSFRCW